MSSIPKEQLAVVVNEFHKPVIETIPVTLPTKNQVLIKTEAVSINPTDWKHITGQIGETNSIVGCDAAGKVVAVGPEVKDFKVGDTVSTFVRGAYGAIPFPGAFCEYALGFEPTTFKYEYPLELSKENSISVGPIDTFEEASSITLSLVTVGLSFYNALKLEKGKDYSQSTILIWSGSTSAGTIAIQVAAWLGFKNIVVTASLSNEEAMKNYGATHVFDYKDPEVAKKIKAELGEEITYCLDCFSIPETFSRAYDSLSNTKDSYLDNLLFLAEKDLTGVELKKTKVHFGGTISYAAMGFDVKMGPYYVPYTEEIKQDFAKFHKDFLPYLQEKKLLHMPLKVFPKGLFGIIDGLAYSQSGSYSNLKLVSRISDTPK